MGAEQSLRDTRTYAEVVKGVPKPIEINTNELGYPIISDCESEDEASPKVHTIKEGFLKGLKVHEPEAEAEKASPIICTLSEDFLKTVKVQESDPRTIYNDKVILVEELS